MLQRPENKSLLDEAYRNNRRVVVYVFPTWLKGLREKWPCPRASEPGDGCRAMFWRDGDERRKAKDRAREHATQDSTFACRFYDRFARFSPSERTRRVIPAYLLDGAKKRMAGTPFRATADAMTVSGTADNEGKALIEGAFVSRELRLEWGAGRTGISLQEDAEARPRGRSLGRRDARRAAPSQSWLCPRHVPREPARVPGRPRARAETMAGREHARLAVLVSPRRNGTRSRRRWGRTCKRRPRRATWEGALSMNWHAAWLAIGLSLAACQRARVVADSTEAGAADASRMRPITAEAAAAIPKRVRRLRNERPSAYCPAGMAYVPGGAFKMGSLGNETTDFSGHPMWRMELQNMTPAHGVTVRPFCLALAPVTVAEYAACVASNACAALPQRDEPSCRSAKECVGASEAALVGRVCNWTLPGHEEHPANCVDSREAAAYCHRLGQRLPTEIEWERAARGSDERFVAYGRKDLPKACDGSPEKEPTCPVASFPDVRSPYGLFDMAFAPREWTASPYCDYPRHDCATADIAVRGGLAIWQAATTVAGGGESRPAQSGSHIPLRRRRAQLREGDERWR